jgi:hypothetical protein
VHSVRVLKIPLRAVYILALSPNRVAHRERSIFPLAYPFQYMKEMLPTEGIIPRKASAVAVTFCPLPLIVPNTLLARPTWLSD